MMLRHARHALPVTVSTAAAVAMLAGCGSTTAGAGGSSSSAGSSSSQAAGTASASSAGGAITVSHAQGKTTLPKVPQRIVVLDYAALDTIDALGGTVVATPKKTLPPSLTKFKGANIVDAGTLKEPNIEKVKATKPDLIVIGGRSASLYKELSKVAPTIDMTLKGKDAVADYKSQVTTLGTVLGKSDEAKSKIAAIDSTVSRIKAKGQNAGTGLILMTSGGKVSTFGPGSRFGLIHDALGLKPTANTIKADGHGQAVSFEFVNQAKPNRLFVIDRDSAIGQSGKSAKAVLDNPLVNATPAGKNNKITYLDGQNWYLAGNGLRILPAMLQEVEKGLG
ncbi:siderophore ABC transporter substrate-binding protein [Yimella sp. cx-51]|uniref:siderophore ABC transporter substrate-binding protein n=2 Tax=Yimella sp. cx-51 TaxID=2770551 RepID=UPI00165E31E1|nr:siderophore ABC transporter substrate-binding protein [Yimella sp. cx-51]MBC9955561.1 siderophore ABC transporter substrate-binding protein [Yimella sp. cx-51]